MGQTLLWQGLRLCKSGYMLPLPYSESRGLVVFWDRPKTTVRLWAETPSCLFFLCLLSWVRALLASLNLCLSSSWFVSVWWPTLCGILCLPLLVSIACCVYACLHPPPARPVGILKTPWEWASLLGFPTRSLSHLAILELLFPSRVRVGMSSSAVPPALSSKFLSLFLPPLLLGMDFGENVFGGRELDTLCGLSNRGKEIFQKERGRLDFW